MSNIFSPVEEKSESQKRNLYSFILKFLAELPEKGIKSIRKEELSGYVSYVINDLRNFDLVDRLYPNQIEDMVEEVVSKIPSPYFIKPIILSDGTDLVLNPENL